MRPTSCHFMFRIAVYRLCWSELWSIPCISVDLWLMAIVRSQFLSPFLSFDFSCLLYLFNQWLFFLSGCATAKLKHLSFDRDPGPHWISLKTLIYTVYLEFPLRDLMSVFDIWWQGICARVRLLSVGVHIVTSHRVLHWYGALADTNIRWIDRKLFRKLTFQWWWNVLNLRQSRTCSEW